MLSVKLEQIALSQLPAQSHQSFRLATPMLLWASILLAILGGIGVTNFASLPWIGDLFALTLAISLFVAVCAGEART